MKKSWFELALGKSQWINDCLVYNGYKNHGGYGRVTVSNKKYSLHRLSYKKSKGEIPEGLLVRHTCDNPSCWNPEHLILGTVKDNAQDMIERGRNTNGVKGHTNSRGSKSGKSKLTEDQVLEIMKLLNETDLLQRVIAKRYLVSTSTISLIKNGKRYSEVTS